MGLGCLLLATLIVHWHWFLPGQITNQDWWNYTPEGMRALWPSPSTINFDHNIGGDWRDNINYFPMEALFGLLGVAGLSFDAASKIAIVFPTLLLIATGGYLLGAIYVRNPLAALAAGA